jgi:hypothetical protein
LAGDEVGDEVLERVSYFGNEHDREIISGDEAGSGRLSDSDSSERLSLSGRLSGGESGRLSGGGVCCVRIVPSGFFDEGVFMTEKSLPTMPLKSVEGVPLLFGKPDLERVGDTLVVHADIIASAFFMLSRYEEAVRRSVRDRHGRFVGKESLSARAGFIARPIVDEYGILLRKWLSDCGFDLKPRPQQINRLYLTHDIDAPFAYRTWRNIARGVLRERRNPLELIRIMKGEVRNDPYFSALLELYSTDRVEAPANAEVLTFIRSGGEAREDRPFYWRCGQDSDLKALMEACLASSGAVGLHSSYTSAGDTSLINKEKATLEDLLGREVGIHRNHFLASREPEDMRALEKAGFTDDFTLGYADVAGFRLGTSRPVRYIDAAEKRLSSSLMLHPLTVMDSTLTDYMGLSDEEAEDYCRRLVEQARLHNGDVCLLWHNATIAANTRRHAESLQLYKQIIRKCE